VVEAPQVEGGEDLAEKVTPQNTAKASRLPTL
jgi:hypothetical protein